MKNACLVAACVLLSVVGCTAAPTASAPLISDPLYDGFGFGSGHVTEPDTTYDESATTLEGAAADGDTSGDDRSGFGFGSGH